MVRPPPLAGLKVIEFAGLAPGPFAGMLLADAGASVVRIDRPAPDAAHPAPTPDLLTRRKASIAVDLRDASPRGGAALVRALARTADVLIDPFRPGVLERLGLGPTELLAANPRLVYARLSGFRRDGRYKDMAGHDVNYLAVAGVLAMLGRSDSPPQPPANLLADFAGGGASVVLGVLLALLARDRDGRGQVVEASMVDGASYLATFLRFARRTPLGDRPRGRNVLDGGCPFYDVYETRDGGYVAVGALEPRFFKLLVRGLGLTDEEEKKERRDWVHDEAARHDRARWPEMRRVFAERFRARTRAEWEAVFDGVDACCTPVLEYDELEASQGQGLKGGGSGGKREGDQRPPVVLRDTPLLAVRQKKDTSSNNSSGNGDEDDDITCGQGPGVPGDGYVGQPLAPGHGGEAVLRDWLGWTKGREFEVESGGTFVLLGSEGRAKL